MKLFTSDVIRKWDEFTIDTFYAGNSSELMEQAADAVVFELQNTIYATHYSIFCGTGNNGGDGLCIARLLQDEEVRVQVFIVGNAENGSKDFRINLKRLLETDIPVTFLSESNLNFQVPKDGVVLDCLIGTGISRPVEGWLALLIEQINMLQNMRIAIDVPSGLNPDMLDVQTGNIIKADKTFTFQLPKRAFLFAENFEYTGEFRVLPIGLDYSFEERNSSTLMYYDEALARNEFQPRTKFAYKNNFGHVRIIAGSKGKMGAAILASRAAMRSGAGLVTASVPACGLDVMQIAIPEVMCEADDSNDVLKDLKYDDSFSATAIGPGLGKAPETVLMLRRLLKDATRPLVLDADALNIIAEKNLIKDVPKQSILTPHVGEFDRLFGKHESSFERLTTAITKANEQEIIIVLKGAHTATVLPNGDVYFNSTGNVGMATAGSGDTLTGVIASLLGQGYSPEVAARLAVFIHGQAGDLAADQNGFEGMIAGDIIDMLPSTFDLFEGGFPEL